MPLLVAFYDANVLYPAPLRDLLVRLGVHRIVRAHWSELVHEEWIRSLLSKRPGRTGLVGMLTLANGTARGSPAASHR